MIFALNQHGYRISPDFSGQRASCSHCGSEVVAKCGEIYAWHWQHVSGQLCDPWKEHETEWHRNWKAKFPAECQEVSIVIEFEKHIADVRTCAGLVIEFQNSSISPETIRIREQFYGQMVWVINAGSFKGNFSIKSVVRRKLRELEEDRDPYSKRVVEDTKKLLSEIDVNRKKAKEKAELIARLVEYRENDQKKVQGYLQDVEKFCKQILDDWKSGKEYYNSLIANVIEQLKQNKSVAQELATKVNTLTSLQKTIQSNIEYIDNLGRFNLHGTGYKIVPYEILNKDNYSRFFAVPKNSMSDLFPVIEPIPDETAYHQFKFRQDQYCFVIDPAPAYQKCQDLLKETTAQLIQTITVRQSIENTMIQQATELFRLKLDEIDHKISDMKRELESALETLAELEKYKLKMSEAQAIELMKAHALDEQDNNSGKYSLMRTFKGQYDLGWKHERKSWRNARCRLFFDLQDGFLYERTARWKVRKLTIQDFLSEMATRV